MENMLKELEEKIGYHFQDDKTSETSDDTQFLCK